MVSLELMQSTRGHGPSGRQPRRKRLRLLQPTRQLPVRLPHSSESLTMRAAIPPWKWCQLGRMASKPPNPIPTDTKCGNCDGVLQVICDSKVSNDPNYNSPRCCDPSTLGDAPSAADHRRSAPLVTPGVWPYAPPPPLLLFCGLRCPCTPLRFVPLSGPSRPPSCRSTR